MGKRRKFTRRLGERRYKKLFLLATEGEVTEPQYFAIFNDAEKIVWVKCLPGRKKSAPLQVLRRMRNELRTNGIAKRDEAWLVVDTDAWREDDLRKLHEWALEKENRGLAVSNPNFEYWLLLHFEAPGALTDAGKCSRKLREHLKDYDKRINPRLFPIDKIRLAVERAKKQDNPPCLDWPRKTGSTVYKLVGSILNRD